MNHLERIGVAIESDLLRKFDRHNEKHGYENRSEAFRDLIRARLASEEVESPEANVAGAITMVYDHHKRLLPEQLTEIQHKFHSVIISAVHAHLDHDTCLEVVVVRGKAGQVRKLADALTSRKGVHHGRLVMTAPSISSPPGQ